MSSPMKRAAFKQGILATSADKKEELGTLRITHDGRKFRYARAGAAALAAGKIGIAVTLHAGVIDENCASAHAIGEKIFTETITAGGVYPTNYFSGGFLQANDATGEGHQYYIEASTAIAAGDTSVTLELSDPIRVALVAVTTQFSIIASPWMAVTESATEENMPVGVAPVVVPINHYYWAQTGGIACVLASGAIPIGTKVVLGAVAGSVKAVPSALDADQNFPVGIAFGAAAVDTEYAPMYLTID